MNDFNVTIIGSGSAKPHKGNLCSCQLLKYKNMTCLIDCCDGCTAELIKLGVSINKINNIFITHAHGDHCLGLPALIATMAINSRDLPLSIFAPSEVFDILDPVIEYMAGDYDRIPFCIDKHEVSAPYSYSDFKRITYSLTITNSDADFKVYAVPLNHGNVTTYGYIFSHTPKMRHINFEAVSKYNIPKGAFEWIRNHDWELDDGTMIPNKELTLEPDPAHTYAYISDTYRFKELPEYLNANNVTTLYCEATYRESEKELATKYQHCTAEDAARIAKDTKTVKKLIIGHVSARYEHPEDSILESNRIFSETSYATKNETFEII